MIASSRKRANQLLDSMDVYVLIDALAVVMGHEEKELCRLGQMAIALVLDTAITVVGNKDRVREICMISAYGFDNLGITLRTCASGISSRSLLRHSRPVHHCFLTSL